MKLGRSLSDIAKELERQQTTKKDYIVDTSVLEMSDEAKLIGAYNHYPATNHAHGQIAARLSIPRQYYEKMRESTPALLAQNVNYWLQKTPERRMIRILDGEIRAFLSDRYRPLDNYDLAEAVLPELSNAGVQIVSAEVTDTRMYIKATTNKVQFQVSKGDVVRAGIVISNSEIGAGSLRVEPLVYRLVCENGMIANDHALKKYHVGRRSSNEELNARFFRAATRSQSDKAFFMQVNDTVRGVLTSDGFETIVSSLRGLKNFQMDDKKTDVQQLVEDVTGKFKMSDGEQNGILRHLTEGGDLSGYGVMNAVTRTAGDVENYDRATEIERFGGMMTSWSIAEWKTVGMVRS